MEGTPIKFPKGLAEAVSKAEVFSAEDVEESQLTIDLRLNKLRITGEGATGKYEEWADTKYKGKLFSFKIASKLFEDLIRHHNTCQVSADRLKVVTGKYSYVTVLQVPAEKKKKKTKTKKETKKYEGDDIPF